LFAGVVVIVGSFQIAVSAARAFIIIQQPLFDTSTMIDMFTFGTPRPADLLASAIVLQTDCTGAFVLTCMLVLL
jgi:hypothetical protein